jgi:hypothetical protein
MKSILLVLVGLIGVTQARADILRLLDGRMFTGEFLGATKDQIFFQADIPGGIAAPTAYPTAQVESLTFGPVAKQSIAAPLKPSAQLRSKRVSECYTRGSRESQKADATATQ